ncbi:MAG: HAMP domain-containing histidine kinase [Oscillospiraceae bacterium]|nr:HAMP domain-containing histidine kinase [Oscillospiraceae bacterium]
MHRITIAKKWMLYTVLPVALILTTVVILAYIGIRSYYYNEASNYLSNKANVLYREVNSDSVKNSVQVSEIVATYEEKEKIELMSLDSTGRVMSTSSGFYMDFTEPFPDFESAVNSSSSRGSYTGIGQNGERIMAISLVLPEKVSEVRALRLVISIEQIDDQILKLTGFVLLGAVALLFIFFIAGLSFVRSITLPLKNLSKVATTIASGDFDYRIQPKSNDEIGDLCISVNNMAEELGKTDKMQNEFISSVSHELRTPLTAIQGWIETLGSLKDTESVEYKNGMKIIASETTRLSTMVEELLDFSRIRRSGSLSMTFEEVDVVAELTEAYLMFKQRVAAEDKILEYEEPEEIISVCGDRYRLKQVFVNIIDNAIKYSEAETTVSIKLDHDEDWVSIRIIDNGKGIDSKDMPYIKNKFSRADHSVKGSGIGLAVANEIVALHKGELDIKSEKGVGTVVTIKLPAFGRYEI